MEALFPLDAGISEMRGIIKLTADNGNTVGISKLAKETKRGIDLLLPIIDACRLLGICTVKGGVVTLTNFGKSLTTPDIQKELAKKLARIEPFKSSLCIIRSQGGISTKRLSEVLKRKGITLYTERSMNEEMLKNLLLKWAVRSKLLSYDQKSESWHAA